MKVFSFVIGSFLSLGYVYGDGAQGVEPLMEPPKYCSLDNPTCRSVLFGAYGDLLFLQPNGSSIYYAAEAFPLNQSISVPAVSPNWQIYEISPSYSPGFKIGAKVFFSDVNTNLEANWEALYTTDTASYEIPHGTDGGAAMIGPLFVIGPNAAAYQVANTSIDFSFNSVDLIFGQQWCLFQRLYPNVFAGAGFIRIEQTLSSTYSQYSGIPSRGISNYSTFTGAGPKFGLDFDYRIVAGFFFTGSASLGLIIGESQNGTTYQSYSSYLTSHNIPQPNTQTTTVPNRTQLIPAIEEKMGFSYAGIFKCCKWELGAGYQAEIYLNAVQSIDMSSQVEPALLPVTVPDAGVYAEGFLRTLSNFILTGPYVTLSVAF